MGRFEEYEFDVRRLWAPRGAQKAPPVKQPRRAPLVGNASAEVVPFPTSPQATSAESQACQKRTRAELRKIALSLRQRDMLRRAWIAERCAACARCPGMRG